MAKKKDPSIAATQVQAKEPSLQKVKELKGHNAWEYLGLSAKVSNSIIYNRNRRFKNCEKHFPHYPLMRTVDKFFPFAELNGKRYELYLDEPESDADVEQCKIKAKALKSEGLNYAYIAPGMELKDVLEQLNGVG